MFAPGVELCDYPFDQIIGAIVDGEVDAGVMIHEEILAYPRAGLQRVADLGVLWCRRSGMPLPVGLNVVRKSLGAELMRAVATGCEQSMRWALENPGEALSHAGGFGRGLAREHLQMFADADSMRLPADARQGVECMVARIAELGLGPAVGGPIVFIEGELDASCPLR